MTPPFDVVIRDGELFDGTGRGSRHGGVAIDGDRLAVVGDVSGCRGRLEVDARGQAVAPGFINMLSWATGSLLVDGRSLSDIHQGVTLEVFGEGVSMGPVNPVMRETMLAEQGDLQFDIPWTSLAEYLAHLERLGVSTNVASFVGATTVRIHELGYDNRAPNRAELGRMRALVQQAMTEGALGVGSSLIYAPAFYAATGELVALAAESAAAGGMYISHIRSEGIGLRAAVQEFISIARQAPSRAEIYHFKAMGQEGLEQFGSALQDVAQARAGGLRISADIYPYIAAATGLDAAMPPWCQEGGLGPWIARLQAPATRARVLAEMRHLRPAWENQVLLSGGAGGVLLAGFKTEGLKPLTGMTLQAVAEQRATTPEETALDLVIEDHSRVSTIYFNQFDEVLSRIMALPWVSLGSDEASLAPEGPFLRSNPHPRAYGSFARFLGRYVRDNGVVSLTEAVRKITGLPAGNLRLRRRGILAVGNYADVVVFDPDRVMDRATYEAPHQLAVGIDHVFVNGVATILHGEHTGARAGRVVHGPGFVRA